MHHTLVNVAIYQFIWFLCVLKGNTGAFFALPLIVLHLYFSECRKSDVIVMGAFLLAGVVIDGGLHLAGFFSFTVSGKPLPFWLVVIWLALSILPNHSLSWMKRRPLLCAIFGALGGPLAYWAGERLGAASFAFPLYWSIPILAVVWAIFWPLAMSLASNLSSNTEKRATGSLAA